MCEDVTRKLETIPLPNDTVHRRIVDLSFDIKQQVVDHIKVKGTFGLWLDDSTDVWDNAQILAYVRYDRPADLKEKFLFCHALHDADVLQMVDKFLKEEKISWTDSFSICSDRAPVMLEV